MLKSPNIELNICMLAYQQAPYVAQAIESVLAQKTSFPIVLHIGEDESTDGTRAICQSYAAKYPETIRLHLRDRADPERGKYVAPFMYNFVETLRACDGKYIALLEGDDYWTDALKLQKQVDYLEANPDVVLCGHKVQILEPTGRLVDDYIAEPRYARIGKDKADLIDLLRIGNFLHTPSVMFRNIIKEFPPEFLLSPVGDYFLYVMLAEHGLIKRLDDVMAVYRNGVGAWSALCRGDMYMRILQTQACLLSYLSSKDLRQTMLARYVELLHQYGEIIEDVVTEPLALASRLTFRNLFEVFHLKLKKKAKEVFRGTK